jgi:hypothetical protein
VKRLLLVLLCVCAGLSACRSTPSEVVQKVKYDFGIGEKPEGYVEPSEKVMARLESVGQSEMKRMNTEHRLGEVKFQQDSALEGKYYKEVKVYENFHPLEVNPVSRGSHGERGYVGFIAYSYRLYQSERFSNRTEAAAASATIGTTETGRETFRYSFSSSGTWTGGEGERVRR